MNTPAPAPHTFDIKNLAARASTALVFGALFLTLLYFGSRTEAKLIFLLLMATCILMGVREMILIGRKMGHQPSMAAACLVAWLLLMHFFLAGSVSYGAMPEEFSRFAASDPLPLWLVLALGGIIIHFSALFSKQNLESALPSQALTWMAALYLGLGLGFQQRIFMYNKTTLENTGARLILALYLIVWLGDTTAYFVGSLLGKHKLAPRVSPKKTWEGLLGNLAGNLGGAFLVRALACTEWSAIDAIALGLLVGLAGSIGDLVESTWKRSAGVKDSNFGRGIPGHGGMLDRVDSLVFAAPVLFAYVHFAHGLN